MPLSRELAAVFAEIESGSLMILSAATFPGGAVGSNRWASVGYPVINLEISDTRADGLHNACSLGTDHRRVGRQSVYAAPLIDVDKIHSDGMVTNSGFHRGRAGHCIDPLSETGRYHPVRSI